MYSRPKQDFFPGRILFTQDDASAVDWLRKLGVTRSVFESQQNDLSKQFGGMAKASDVVWKIMNESVTHSKDRNELKLIYSQMAQFLYEEGKNYFHVAQEVKKLEFAHWQEAADQGLIEWKRTRLKIITCGPASCGECRKLDRAIFTLGQALEHMPLPVRTCSHEPVKPGAPGWCRCSYRLVIER